MNNDKINSSKAPEPVGLRQAGTKKIPGVELDKQGNIVSYNIGKQYHNVLKKN